MSDSASVKLGYWPIRGLAQPLRTMLHYAGVKFTDERYVDGAKWAETKAGMVAHCDFPNLPYLIDGDITMTQSKSILRYIARKFKPELYSGDAATLAKIDQVLDQTVDANTAAVRFVYGATPLETFKTSIVPHLDSFERVFKDGRAFAAGAELSIADFQLWETLDHVKTIFAEVVKEDVFATRPHVAAYWQRFAEVPAVAAYLKSSDFHARPFNGSSAVFK